MTAQVETIICTYAPPGCRMFTTGNHYMVRGHGPLGRTTEVIDDLGIARVMSGREEMKFCVENSARFGDASVRPVYAHFVSAQGDRS